jgi:hypothetical protein
VLPAAAATLLLVRMAGLLAVAALPLMLMAGLPRDMIELFHLVADGPVQEQQISPCLSNPLPC